METSVELAEGLSKARFDSKLGLQWRSGLFKLSEYWKRSRGKDPRPEDAVDLGEVSSVEEIEHFERWVDVQAPS